MSKESKNVKINWRIGLDRFIVCGLLSGILIGKFVYDGYRDGIKDIAKDVMQDSKMETLIINPMKKC